MALEPGKQAQTFDGLSPNAAYTFYIRLAETSTTLASQTSTGLQPNTTYTFTIRLAETQTALASTASESITVTTDDQEPVPVTGGTDTLVLLSLLAVMRKRLSTS